MRAARALDTCDPVDADDWSAANPSRGQCGSTALVIHDLPGGELLIAEVTRSGGGRQGVRYWNLLPGGTELDLTRQQFADEEVIRQPTILQRPAGLPDRCWAVMLAISAASLPDKTLGYKLAIFGGAVIGDFGTIAWVTYPPPVRTACSIFGCGIRHYGGTLCGVQDGTLAGAGGCRFTERLRLEPVGPGNAAHLWRVHNDDEVASWYGNEKPTVERAQQWARLMADSWRFHGVHKWIAYDRFSGELVGRGGLSRTPVDDDWGQIYAFLPAEPWVRAAHQNRLPFVAHANWLEIGWALRRDYWGLGYATEIGRAGLAFGFEALAVQAVVSCTVRHNVRSRAVMARIGMRYVGEIRSRGIVEGADGERDDAPFSVSVLLREEWSRLGSPGA